MKRKFKDLEEAQTFFQDLINHTKIKDIMNIDCDLFLEFMVACQKFSEDEVLNYAEKLGYRETNPNLSVKFTNHILKVDGLGVVTVKI